MFGANELHASHKAWAAIFRTINAFASRAIPMRGSRLFPHNARSCIVCELWSFEDVSPFCVVTIEVDSEFVYATKSIFK